VFSSLLMKCSFFSRVVVVVRARFISQFRHFKRLNTRTTTVRDKVKSISRRFVSIFLSMGSLKIVSFDVKEKKSRLLSDVLYRSASNGHSDKLTPARVHATLLRLRARCKDPSALRAVSKNEMGLIASDRRPRP